MQKADKTGTNLGTDKKREAQKATTARGTDNDRHADRQRCTADLVAKQAGKQAHRPR